MTAQRTRACSLLAAMSLLLMTGCDQASPLPSTQVYMLVDLSETWHNDVSDERNLKVLTEVGLGAAQAARTISDQDGRPVSVQTRIIGAGSLGREPICDVIFENKLIKIGDESEDRLSDPGRLAEYLGTDCPRKLLALPPEGKTEISNALLSVAAERTIDAKQRKIVIISDFLEEAIAPELPQSLENYSVLMIYRPLAADQADARAFGERIEAWKQLLLTRNAESVEVVPDTSIKREVVAYFLTKPSAPSHNSTPEGATE